MELDQAVTTLQDEMKLLKGEIKTILKDIRSAVLSADNPFTAGVKPPTFNAVARPGSNDAADEPGVEQAEEDEAQPPSDTLPLDGPSQPPGTPPLDGPSQPPGMPPLAGPGQPPLGVALPGSDNEPTPIRPPTSDAPASSPPQWNLLTIASLTAWAEDAVKTLGQQRFQIVLELACLAEVLSTEVQEVLGRVAELAPAKKENYQPLNVNDCLVVLNQLEAILQGEKVTKLRRRRSSGRRSRLR